MQTRAEQRHATLNHPAHPLLISYGVTDCGRVRRANEDCFVMYPEAGVFVVCDGMGGAAAGEMASRIAAETAAMAMRNAPAGADGVRDAVRLANTAVYERARKDVRLEGMGTTMVCLMVAAGIARLAHVGDSRCYRWRRGELDRLTHDHSLVEEQIRVGRMTPEQAKRSPMQNVITRAVGTRDQVVPEVQEIHPLSGDIYLLASDGLTRDLTDEVLAGIIASSPGDLPTAGDALISAANAAGGRDNITCVLVRIAA